MPLPEKTQRNKAIIALKICGFGLRTITRLLSVDYGNMRRFIVRDQVRYSKEIMATIADYILKVGQPTQKKKK